MKKYFALILLLLVFVTGVTVNAASDSPTDGTLNGNPSPKVAVWDVGTYADLLLDEIPGAELTYYFTSAEMALSVRQKKTEAMVIGKSYYDYFIDDFEGLTPLEGDIGTCEKALLLAPDEKGQRLLSEINEFISKCKKDGTMKELADIWFSTDTDRQNIDFSVMPEDGEVIVFGTDQSEPPYCLLKDGNLQGFDLDFMVRFCGEYGYNLDVRDDGYDAIEAGIQTGKYDVCGAGFEYDEERAEEVSFSDSMYTDKVIILVPEKVETVGFFKAIEENFQKTFIREDRYRLFAAGLGRTLLMTGLSALFGTILGFILYFINRDGGKVASVIISIFVTIFKLVPILVILMILYYIVFGNVYINGIWVSVLTFTLIFGARVFDILDTAIDTLDKGQTEAAFTLGFSKNATFFHILLPQAAKFFLPMYRDELIALVEETSVVGYIAIQDVTRVSDIVRAQTFEPFFPLIVTACIYVLIAFIIIWIIRGVYKAINTKNRSRDKILKKIGLND